MTPPPPPLWIGLWAGVAATKRQSPRRNPRPPDVGPKVVARQPKGYGTRCQRCIGRGGGTPPPPSRAPSLCPAAVPPTASAGFNGICNRQQPPPTALATPSNRLPNRFGNLLQPPAQPLWQPPPTACPTALATSTNRLPNRFGNLLQPPAQPLWQPPPTACPTALATSSNRLPNRFANLLQPPAQPPAQPLLGPPLRSLPFYFIPARSPQLFDGRRPLRGGMGGAWGGEGGVQVGRIGVFGGGGEGGHRLPLPPLALPRPA